MVKLLRPVHNPPLPFKHEIRGAFAGRLIYVYGTVPSNADRFVINILAGEDIALHFNPRFNEGSIVRNSKIDNAWGQEDREGGLPLKPGDKFDITIRMRKRLFKILVNGKQFDNFGYRTALKEITHLEISGDVQVKRIQFEVKNQDWLPANEIDRPSIGKRYEVPYANAVGHKLVVVGKPSGGRFSFNFEDEKGNFLYHFNPRDDENVIVGNTKFNEAWQQQETHKMYPFHQGTPYMVEIVVTRREYQVTVNGMYQLSYDHRDGRPTDIAHVRIEGSTDVEGMKFI